MSEEDRKVGIEDFKNQEVKRVNKADIFAAGLEKGREVSNAIQVILLQNLSTLVNEKNALEAIKYCNIHAYPMVDSISNTFGVEIKRASNRYRNINDAPDELEAQLLDAYEYSIENGYTLTDNIQEYDIEFLLYTKPILAASPMCLECHGKNVDSSVKEQIDKLYPGDKALNHQLNDLRGMWSIKIPVKEIVNGLE